MSGICSYQKCLTCNLATCETGRIAREQGELAYLEHIAMMDEAEEAMQLANEEDTYLEHTEIDYLDDIAMMNEAEAAWWG